jgi:hypothetical protein
MQRDRSVGPFASSAVTRPDSLQHFGVTEQQIQTACHIRAVQFNDGELVVGGVREWTISSRYIFENLLGSLPALIKDKQKIQMNRGNFFSGDPSGRAV